MCHLTRIVRPNVLGGIKRRVTRYTNNSTRCIGIASNVGDKPTVVRQHVRSSKGTVRVDNGIRVAWPLRKRAGNEKKETNKRKPISDE